MADLPDPKSPLNKMEQAVYGIDSCRHPITGFCISRAGKHSLSPAMHPNHQAYEYLAIIRREHGDAVYLDYKNRLDEFVRNGGQVDLPPEAKGI